MLFLPQLAAVAPPGRSRRLYDAWGGSRSWGSSTPRAPAGRGLGGARGL